MICRLFVAFLLAGRLFPAAAMPHTHIEHTPIPPAKVIAPADEHKTLAIGAPAPERKKVPSIRQNLKKPLPIITSSDGIIEAGNLSIDH